MPFNSSDITAKVNALFQSRELQELVSNPFIVGVLYTVVVMAIIITVSQTVATKDFVMTGFMIYIASIMVATFVARGLLARYDTKFAVGSGGIMPYMHGFGEDAGDLADSDYHDSSANNDEDGYPLIGTDFLNK